MSNLPAHSRIGASGAKRWMTCTASIELCAKAPEQKSKFADEGQKAHLIAEKLMRGKQVPEGEMKEHAKIYSSTIVGAYIDADEPGPIHYESRVRLPSLSPQAFGTVDCWFYDKGTRILYVFDYKYGAGVLVNAEDNYQMRYYAAAIIETHNLDVKEAELWIVQPRMDNIDFEVVIKHELNIFLRQARNALSGPKTLVEGEHCRFCNALSFCPSKIASIKTAFAVDVAKKLTHASLRKPADMNDAEILQALDNAELLSSWISSVRKYAENYVQMGGVLPGYALEETVGNRAYKDESEVIRYFSFLSEEELYNKKLKSPAQLEKVITKDNKKALDGLTKREVTGIKLKKLQTNADDKAVNQFVAFTEGQSTKMTGLLNAGFDALSASVAYSSDKTRDEDNYI